MDKQELQQILGEVFDEKLEPFAKSVQEDFMKVNTRLDRVDKRLEHIDGRIGNLENEWKEFRKNSSELFAKLDKFIKLYEDQKQELASLSAQVNRLQEEVDYLKSKL